MGGLVSQVQEAGPPQAAAGALVSLSEQWVVPTASHRKLRNPHASKAEVRGATGVGSGNLARFLVPCPVPTPLQPPGGTGPDNALGAGREVPHVYTSCPGMWWDRPPGALSQELWAPGQEGEGLPWTGGTSPGGWMDTGQGEGVGECLGGRGTGQSGLVQGWGLSLGPGCSLE